MTFPLWDSGTNHGARQAGSSRTPGRREDSDEDVSLSRDHQFIYLADGRQFTTGDITEQLGQEFLQVFQGNPLGQVIRIVDKVPQKGITIFPVDVLERVHAAPHQTSM
jgi:hypothetical protein